MSEMGMAMMGAGVARGEDRALMAANAAVGSPLLEDVDLSGALGLLVNITAGLNLSMREFEEIGSTISDLASDDATVVIGTVIDPEMDDELRVTVVATGLGEMQAQNQGKPMKLVRNATTGAVEHSASSETDEAQQEAEAASQLENKDLFENQADIDFLDIPAFLRTQAD